VGAEAVVGVEGRKNCPGIQAYQTLPIAEVALDASVKSRLKT
jgi:hypothetical protein